MFGVHSSVDIQPVVNKPIAQVRFKAFAWMRHHVSSLRDNEFVLIKVSGHCCINSPLRQRDR